MFTRQTFQIVFIILLGYVFLINQSFCQDNWETLFYDDFDKGSSENWKLEEGWWIHPSEPGYVLAGENHSWASCRQGEEWYDYTFSFYFKKETGTIHANFRVGDRGRYMLGIGGEEVYLTRDLEWGNYTVLESMALPVSEGIWHQVKIYSNLKAIQVFIDKELIFQVWDNEALLSGSVAFETLENSIFYIDSVKIIGPPYMEPPEGYEWIRTGGPPGGLGYDIRIHPQDKNIVIVTDNPSGVNKSYDGGKTWKRRNDGITIRTGSSNEDIPIFSATIDPGNPHNIWCGTQNITGIFKSENTGESWMRKDQGITEYTDVSFRGFAIHPSNSDLVLAAGEIPTVEQGRTFNKTKGVIFKTEDGGTTWKTVWTGNNLARVLLFDYLHPDTIYCSTGIFDREAFNSDKDLDIPGGVGILRSYDGGESWTEINHGIENLYTGYLEMHPEDPSTLFAASGNHAYLNGEGQIYKTTDGGETWRKVIEGTCFSAIAISKSNPDVVYAINGEYCYRSSDQGESWKAYQKENEGVWGPPGIKPGIPISAAVDPYNENRIFVNNYNGGNFISSDGGKTWINSSDGYTGADIRDILIHPEKPEIVVASGRNGIFKTVNGGRNWFGITNGHAGTDLNSFTALDTDLDTIIGAVEGEMNLIATWNGGLDWKPIYHFDSIPLTGSGFHRISEITVAPSDPLVIYAGFDHNQNIGNLDPDGLSALGMYVSMDGGQIWNEISNGLGPQAKSINTIAIHPDSAQVVYVGTFADGIYRSRDGGNSWMALNNGLGSTDIRSIAIDPDHPQVIYAGSGNGMGIYKSTNGGDLWVERNTGIPLKCPSYGSSFGKVTTGMDLDRKSASQLAAGYSQVAWTKILDIAIDPSNTNNIYVADYSTGIHLSLDAGKTWTTINNGISLRTVTCLTISPDGSVLYAGIKGNGVMRLVRGNKAPGIQLTIPNNSVPVVLFKNDTIDFTIIDYDLNGDSLIYEWFLDQEPLQNNTTTFSLMGNEMTLGAHTLIVKISDRDTSIHAKWQLEVQELPSSMEEFGEENQSQQSILIYPNPFKEEIYLQYLLPFDADVSIEIFDLLGRKIRNYHPGKQLSGSHRIFWDGRNEQGATIPNGIYVLRFSYQSDDKTLMQERKIIHTR